MSVLQVLLNPTTSYTLVSHSARLTHQATFLAMFKMFAVYNDPYRYLGHIIRSDLAVTG